MHCANPTHARLRDLILAHAPAGYETLCAQIEHALIDLFGMHTPQNRLAMALDEARNAIRDVERGTRRMVELAPQISEIRKQQHDLVRTAKLRSLSNGNDPHRRVRVYQP